ncbi:hypothetical protein [Roseomonas populi]|uniref:Uncharacterized protein n=1 Tax=Roseomonas populi TaxID=3121582 RepID=A0ABT1X153_9PROT|nr:hypothetical protein [Roseomonas pecuniae]MCR0981836.1 hypothetical protein [Roseomonas pecuniae]
MSERGSSIPVWSAVPSGPKRPDEGVLSAISELADHARAYRLSQVDDVLTELLALLYTEQDRAPAFGASHLSWSAPFPDGT